MTTYYLRNSDGDDASDGLTWANAKKTLHTATTGALATASGAGDIIYIADENLDSVAASITLTAQGTAANPTKIIGVSDSASSANLEPPDTFASSKPTVINSGANAINFAGFCYYKNIDFQVASSTSTAGFGIGSTVAYYIVMDNCNLHMNATGAGRIYFGSGASTSNDDDGVNLINCSVQFSATTQGVALANGRVRATGLSVTTDNVPATLFHPIASTTIDVVIGDSDLSYVTGNLVNGAVAASGRILLRNCKIADGVTVVTGSIPGPGGVEVILENCDDGTVIRQEKYCYAGTIVNNTTNYRTLAYSWCMTASANTTYTQPLESLPIYQYNTIVSGNATVTLEIISDATLHDDDIWMEVEYMASDANPLGTIDYDTKYGGIGAHLPGLQGTASTNAHATSTPSPAWTESIASEVKQKLVATIAPRTAGYVIVRVYLAKASQVVYVDPVLAIAAA